MEVTGDNQDDDASTEKSSEKSRRIETMDEKNSDANANGEDVDGKQAGVADVNRGTNNDENRTMGGRESDEDANSKSGNVQPAGHRKDHNGNEEQTGGDAITPTISTPASDEAIDTGNKQNNETPVGDIEPTRLFKTMRGVNHTKEMRIHSSQWLLYTGLFANHRKPGHFQEFMPNVNHGVRQNRMIANIINTLLGNPANIQTASERSSTYNNDMIFQRLYNLVSTMTMTMTEKKTFTVEDISQS